MKKEFIELPSHFNKDALTICALQLLSPFQDGDDSLRGAVRDLLYYFGWNVDRFSERDEKILNVIASLKTIHKKRRIDVFIFPEYALSTKHLEAVRELSRDTNSIVIANCYLEEQRKNITVTYIEGNEGHRQVKHAPSELDKNYLAEPDEEERRHYCFSWMNSDGQLSYIQIFTCMEFLTSFNLIDFTVPGIIFVPMCSPDTAEFEGVSSYIIRSGRDPKANKAVILANNASRLRVQRPQMAGQTQIIASSRELRDDGRATGDGRTRQCLSRTHEGGIIADVAPSDIAKKPTQICQSNSAIQNASSFYLRKDGTLEKTVSSDKSSIAINPNVLSKFGLKKIYVFYDVDQYEQVKPSLRKLPVSCSGIFGVHDILLQSFEENWNFFDLRLSHTLGVRMRQLVRPSWHLITECYKFRGKQIVHVEEDKTTELTPIEIKIRHDELDGLRNPIQNILLGKDVDSHIIHGLSGRNILLECSGDSDIRQEEIADNKEEFLVFVFFRSNDLTDLNMSINKFKISILPNLLADPRIRTIELSGSTFGSLPTNPCCILHVVGHISDLRDIVLQELHKQMFNYSLQYGTRVVPIAEKLSSDQFNSLIETLVNDDELGKAVHSIIHYMEGYEDAFMIKRLPYHQLVQLCQLYERYKEWIAECEIYARHKNLYLRNIDEFIYGIAYAYCTPVEEYAHHTFDHFVERFILNISKVAENILQQIKTDKAYDMGIDKFTKLVGKVLTGYKHNDTNLGTLVLVFNKWNNVYKTEHGCLGDAAIELDLDILQRFANIRNTLAHTSKGNKPSIDEIQQLIDLTVKAFDFIRIRFCTETSQNSSHKDA